MNLSNTTQSFVLETERLRLRQFHLGDSRFIIELLNSPGWLEFIGDRNVKTKEQAENYLKNGPMKSYEQNGFGLSMVETRDGVSIGMCGILRRDTLEHPDLGFAFLPEYISKGYGFEIGSAVLTYAKNDLKFSTILAITLPANTKSIKLLEKIGFTYVKNFRADSTSEELLLYSA